MSDQSDERDALQDRIGPAVESEHGSGMGRAVAGKESNEVLNAAKLWTGEQNPSETRQAAMSIRKAGDQTDRAVEEGSEM